MSAPGRRPVPGTAAAAGRVAAVHRQSRPTLGLAAVFTVAAGAALVVPHRTGTWLPVHLFLLGGVLLAISAATQLLAVTWGAAPAPPDRPVAVQRGLVALGAIGLVVGRELALPLPVVAAAGLAVVGGLALLGALLWRLRATAIQARFAPVVDHDLVALALGAAGSSAGLLLAVGGYPVAPDRLRAAHLTANLLGLVGVVIAGSLPWFVATTAKVRVSPRATAGRQRALLGVLAAATVTATVGELAGSRTATGVGLAGYALGWVGVLALVPRLRGKQLRWAGPRLAQLLAGTVWVAAAVAVAAAHGTLDGRAVLVLVVGGFGQVVAGALAYLGPVLRGGGHERLTEGFALTRSWLGLAAGSVATVAAALGLMGLLQVAAVVWVADLAVRAAALAHGRVRRSAAAPPSPG